MIKEIKTTIPELKLMKKYPKELFYKGNINLLKRRKISIVGSRRPNSYTKAMTFQLANQLSKNNIVIVSGAAIGVDTIAHKSAGSNNTIAVVANGLDIRYPAINNKLIESIENNGLVLSSYKKGEKARNYTFIERNEIVVSLGEILIVTQADENSGTLTSINYAFEKGKKIYTIPHHLGNSIGTQKLLDKGLIEAIYDMDKFLKPFKEENENKDELSFYINSFPTYDEAIKKYPEKIFELELEGKIVIENGKIIPL